METAVGFILFLLLLAAVVKVLQRLKPLIVFVMLVFVGLAFAASIEGTKFAAMLTVIGVIGWAASAARRA